MFKRDHKTLTEAADKLEQAANAVEKGFDAVVGFLESVEAGVSDFVDNVRNSVEKLRAEAASFEEPVAEEKTSTATREEKVAFINQRLNSLGIPDSKWAKKEFVALASQGFVDATYKAFGGK